LPAATTIITAMTMADGVMAIVATVTTNGTTATMMIAATVTAITVDTSFHSTHNLMIFPRLLSCV